MKLYHKNVLTKQNGVARTVRNGEPRPEGLWDVRPAII